MDISQLLRDRYTPDYLPPDIAAAQTQQLFDQLTAVSPSKPSLSHQEITDRLNDVVIGARALADSLAPNVNTRASLTLPDGSAAAVPTPDEYLTLSVGNPTLAEAASLRAFDAYHLSERGNLDAFIYLDARALGQEANTWKGDPAFTELDGAIHDGDNGNPVTMVLDYYDYRVEQAQGALWSLSRAALADPLYTPDAVTLADVFGYSSPLALAAADVQDLRAQHGFLRQLRSALRLSYHALNLSFYDLWQQSATWMQNQVFRGVNQLKLRALTTLYDQTVRPLSGKLLEGVANADNTWRKTPFLNHIGEFALAGVLHEVADLQQVLVNIAKEDTRYYQSYTAKGSCLAHKKELRGLIHLLDDALAVLDRILSAPTLRDGFRRELLKQGEEALAKQQRPPTPRPVSPSAPLPPLPAGEIIDVPLDRPTETA